MLHIYYNFTAFFVIIIEFRGINLNVNTSQVATIVKGKPKNFTSNFMWKVNELIGIKDSSVVSDRKELAIYDMQKRNGKVDVAFFSFGFVHCFFFVLVVFFFEQCVLLSYLSAQFACYFLLICYDGQELMTKQLIIQKVTCSCFP